MSALKRDAGVRCWGNTSSVTGAVGLLDRVAALCFADDADDEGDEHSEGHDAA